MSDVAADWESLTTGTPVGNSENDDPSLLLLFQHLKSKSLQTAKGTSEISAKTEFDFVLHNARVFYRMGEFRVFQSCGWIVARTDSARMSSACTRSPLLMVL
jgi:hypothetical protein